MNIKNLLSDVHGRKSLNVGPFLFLGSIIFFLTGLMGLSVRERQPVNPRAFAGRVTDSPMFFLPEGLVQKVHKTTWGSSIFRLKANIHFPSARIWSQIHSPAFLSVRFFFVLDFVSAPLFTILRLKCGERRNTINDLI